MPTLSEMQRQIGELVVAKGHANSAQDVEPKLLRAFIELGEAGDLIKKGTKLIGIDEADSAQKHLEGIVAFLQPLKSESNKALIEHIEGQLELALDDISKIKRRKFPTEEEWADAVVEENIDALFYIIDSMRVRFPNKNLDEAFNKKLAKNMGRPYRYGESVIPV